jgi:glycine betaine/proline transport system substrate-binding protein
MINKKHKYMPVKSLLIGFFMFLALPASAVESKDPIKLTIHDWTGQYLTTHIMGEERFRSVRTLKE